MFFVSFIFALYSLWNEHSYDKTSDHTEGNPSADVVFKHCSDQQTETHAKAHSLQAVVIVLLSAAFFLATPRMIRTATTKPTATQQNQAVRMECASVTATPA